MAHTEAFARLRRLAATALGGPRRRARAGEAGGAISRRELLRAGGAAAALCAAGCPPIGDASSDGESDTSAAVQPRVVIVGAGLAGLHCALRLKERSIRATVYEAATRGGGRVATRSDGVAEDMVIELGGERIDSDHLTMLALVDEFGLTLEDRAAGAPEGERDPVYWVGGAEVIEATLIAQFAVVAPKIALLADTAVGDPKTFKELDALPLSEWIELNVPVASMPELHAVITTAYRAEFGRETDELSALNLLLLIDAEDEGALRLRGAGDRRYHVAGGNDRLIQAMVDALDADQLVADRQLVAARDGHAGAFVLTFLSAVGTMEEVEADHVVFALPFSALRSCDLAGLTLSAEKRGIIAEHGYGDHTKVIGAFTAPIWRTAHNASGAALTDLDLQETWDASRGQGGTVGLLVDLLGGDAGVTAGMGAAEDLWVSKVLPGVEAIFPGAKMAYDAGSAVRMHWPSAPFHRGSVACYRPGQWSFHGRQGVREGNLHFCGEHCSLDYQRRMEGAVETGALVAHEILDDLTLQASAPLRRLVELKTRGRPHPCYHGDRLPADHVPQDMGRKT